MQDDLRAIRLGHIVRRAVRQGGNLVRLAVALRHHDDRDQRQLRIALHPVQEGIPIHHGHHHVQQNEGDAVPSLGENIQCHLAVLCLQHLILLHQNLTQNGPVQLVVLDHQNLLFHGHSSFFAL